MRAIEPTLSESILSALSASHRAEEIPPEYDLYGWMVGDWDLDVLHFWEDVSNRGLKAELHCSWILEGRALQDLWIMPRVSDRHGPPDPKEDMYGTTLRIWDPSIRAWRISWFNPVAHQRIDQIGRASGSDIVQTGVLPDGTTTRWRFTEISPAGFHWIGDVLGPDGQTWLRQGEFRARRWNR